MKTYIAYVWHNNKVRTPLQYNGSYLGGLSSQYGWHLIEHSLSFRLIYIIVVFAKKLLAIAVFKSCSDLSNQQVS